MWQTREGWANLIGVWATHESNEVGWPATLHSIVCCTPLLLLWAHSQPRVLLMSYPFQLQIHASQPHIQLNLCTPQLGELPVKISCKNKHLNLYTVLVAVFCLFFNIKISHWVLYIMRASTSIMKLKVTLLILLSIILGT